MQGGEGRLLLRRGGALRCQPGHQGQGERLPFFSLLWLWEMGKGVGDKRGFEEGLSPRVAVMSELKISQSESGIMDDEGKSKSNY